jgi:hypothetical protein
MKTRSARCDTDTIGKFATGVNDTGGKFAAGERELEGKNLY